MGGDPPTGRNGPTKIGKYELRKVVGQGSIGVVHEAWDPVLKRVVAVKILRLIDLDSSLGQEKYQRFQREAQAAARLYHPNIAITFDYGETGTLAYIVMEFLDGPSLRELLEHGQVGAGQIKAIMQGLLAGLQHSHDQGVVHRDIKPANILLNRSGQVKITDFGIAHLDDSDLTQLGSQVGTPAYMSPEQVLGDKVDARSDIYSAGVVLYELLTERRPFEGSTNSVMHKIVHMPAPRISDSTTEFSPQVDAVVAKVLAKDQNDRYQSAREFWNALDAALPPLRSAEATSDPSVDSTIVREIRPIKPEAPKSTQPAVPPARPRTGAFASAAVAAGIALVAVIWWLTHKPEVVPEARSPTVAAENAKPTVHQDVAAIPVAPTPPPPAAGHAADRAATPPSPTGSTKASSGQQGAAGNLAARQADLLAGLSGVVARVPCAIVRAQIGDNNTVVLSGVTALGEASELEIRGIVRQSIAALAPTAPVTWDVQRVEGPFCPVFDLLHPLAATTGRGLRIGIVASSTDQSSGKTTLNQVQAGMPGFSGHLIIDAYTGDGLVYHLYPDATTQTLPAGTEVSTSLPGAPGTTNRIATDRRPSLLVAIASSAALLDPSKPANEPMASYLKQLTEALARGRMNGASIVADAAAIGPDAPN